MNQEQADDQHKQQIKDVSHRENPFRELTLLYWMYIHLLLAQNITLCVVENV